MYFQHIPFLCNFLRTLVLIYGFQLVLASRVIELSDRFLEVKHEGVWLVKFYAPWCGHCKKLEPAYSQVAQSLVNTNIRVGRVDCTRFTSVATELSVRGFPTILFIKEGKVTEYKGDRTRDDIIEFARKMDGPAVRYFSSCNDLHNSIKNDLLFFLFVDGTKVKDKGKLMTNYTKIAEEFQPYNYFYLTDVSCLSSVKTIPEPQVPSVYVFKDKSHFVYEWSEADGNGSQRSLYEWIGKERFSAFLKITSGNFYQVLRTGKYIVLAILEENVIHQISLKMQEFRELIEAIALNNRERYHEKFIFGWTPSPELANSIAMMSLPIPSLIVINSSSYQYYLPPVEENEKVPFPQTIIHFLDQISIDNMTALGGDTVLYRIYRAYYEATTSLAGMWKGNPMLTAVLFGLPLGILSIICYTSCCSDILEAGPDEEDETEPEKTHEKHE